MAGACPRHLHSCPIRWSTMAGWRCSTNGRAAAGPSVSPSVIRGRGVAAAGDDHRAPVPAASWDVPGPAPSALPRSALSPCCVRRPDSTGLVPWPPMWAPAAGWSGRSSSPTGGPRSRHWVGRWPRWRSGPARRRRTSSPGCPPRSHDGAPGVSTRLSSWPGLLPVSWESAAAGSSCGRPVRPSRRSTPDGGGRAHGSGRVHRLHGCCWSTTWSPPEPPSVPPPGCCWARVPCRQVPWSWQPRPPAGPSTGPRQAAPSKSCCR